VCTQGDGGVCTQGCAQSVHKVCTRSCPPGLCAHGGVHKVCAKCAQSVHTGVCAHGGVHRGEREGAEHGVCAHGVYARGGVCTRGCVHTEVRTKCAQSVHKVSTRGCPPGLCAHGGAHKVCTKCAQSVHTGVFTRGGCARGCAHSGVHKVCAKCAHGGVHTLMCTQGCAHGDVHIVCTQWAQGGVHTVVCTGVCTRGCAQGDFVIHGRVLHQHSEIYSFENLTCDSCPACSQAFRLSRPAVWPVWCVGVGAVVVRWCPQQIATRWNTALAATSLMLLRSARLWRIVA
jgi:hypothetical protein